MFTYKNTQLKKIITYCRNEKLHMKDKKSLKRKQQQLKKEIKEEAEAFVTIPLVKIENKKNTSILLFKFN